MHAIPHQPLRIFTFHRQIHNKHKIPSMVQMKLCGKEGGGGVQRPQYEVCDCIVHEDPHSMRSMLLCFEVHMTEILLLEPYTYFMSLLWSISQKTMYICYIYLKQSPGMLFEWNKCYVSSSFPKCCSAFQLSKRDVLCCIS